MSFPTTTNKFQQYSYVKIYFSIAFLFLFNITAIFAQTDTCTGAPNLAIVADCTTPTVNYTIPAGYSDSMANPSCANSRKDAWYSFTTGPATTEISISATTNEALALSIYSGTCPFIGADELACAAGLALNNITVVASTTYYLRISRTNNGGGDTTGTICIEDVTPITGPANDECANAIALTVNADLLCGVVTAGTSVGATESIPGITCGSFTGDADDDVWYSFQATATAHVIEVFQGTIGDFVVDLRSGACDGANIDCSDGFGDETINATGLTIGSVYFIRIYSYGGTVGNQGTFDVCVGTEAPCTTPNAPTALTFGTVTLNSIAGSFTEPIPNADNYLVLMNTTGAAPTAPTNGTSYPIGDATLGATVIDDDANANFTATGLTSSTTYYFYVFAFNNTMCLGGPEYAISSLNGNMSTQSPITNDECSGALPLTVNADYACGVVTAGTTNGASASSQPDDVSGTPNNDVWFIFTATTTSHRVSLLNIINVGGGTSTSLDMGIGVYDASSGCASLVLNSTSDPESYTITGLTPGNQYVVRVYGWFSSIQNNNFDVCIGTPPPCTTPNAPTALTFDTVTNNSITASFTASAPAADNYLVLMNDTGIAPTAPTDGITYGIGNGTLGATVIDTDGNTTFTVNALEGSTTYYFYIFAFNNSDCSGGPLYSNSSLNGNTTTDPPALCIPSPTSVDGNGITNVTFSTVNNTTGAEAGNYGDYFAQVGTAQQGASVFVNITYQTGFTYDTTIWVDWNDDLDFDDAGETVYMGASSGANPTTLNATFTVPSGATIGTHRMRIGGRDFGPLTDPCYSGSFGCFEDYGLNITPLTCTDDPSGLIITVTSLTTATMDWTAPVPVPANGYEYIISTDNTPFTPGDDITGTTATTSVSLTGLTGGTTYYVFLRSDCGGAFNQGIWILGTFSTCGITVNTATACALIVDDQANNPFITDPFIADPQVLLSCTSGTTILEAHSQVYETSSYDVESITYNPPVSYEPLGASSISIPSDDVWASTFSSLPFDFCFYGNTYSQCLVGANGAITFNSGIAPGSASGYSFDEDLPSIDESLITNTIYGVYHDVNPGTAPFGEISTRIIDPANIGCRKFVATWHDVPMFQDSSKLYTGMIVLHETTNIIEVFIEEKRVVSSWNDGNAIVGIQGDITEFTVAPCRNTLDPNWETTNEAWRFVPSGAAVVPNSITWYEGSGTGGTVLGSGNTLPITTGNTYTAEVVYPTCSAGTITITDEILVVDPRKVWTGNAGNTDWYDPNNWSNNAIPTAVDCVTIPDVALSNNVSPTVIGGPPVPPPPGQALNVNILNNGYLRVNSFANLVVEDIITVQANGVLDIRNGANVVQINDVINTGNANVQRAPNSDFSAVLGNEYVFWSAPVSGFSLGSVSPGSLSTLIWDWDPTVPGNGVGNHGEWQNPGALTMPNGKGYIIRGLSGTPAVLPGTTITTDANNTLFTGVLNNGTITVPIYRGTYTGGAYTGNGTETMAVATDDNWNLVGNPFPSAISANAFTNLNSNINGTIYLWPHISTSAAIISPFYGDYVYNYNTSDYIEHNNTGGSLPGINDLSIASGQAFFVLMEDSAASGSLLTFDNTMRDGSYDNLSFYSPNFNNDEVIGASTEDDNIERHRIWLDLLTSDNQANSILIGYVDGATDGVDRLYDGFEFVGSNISFYSLIEDEKFSIQGKATPFNENDRVPLGVHVPANDTYSIAINTLDGLFTSNDQGIFIEDLYENIIHDLRDAPYTFTSEAGTTEDRFILRYTDDTLNINSFNADNGVSIITPNNDYIKVTSHNSPINSITMFDISGRIIYNQSDLNSNDYRIEGNNLSNGTYVVKVILTNNKEKTQKVILNK